MLLCFSVRDNGRLKKIVPNVLLMYLSPTFHLFAKWNMLFPPLQHLHRFQLPFPTWPQTQQILSDLATSGNQSAATYENTLFLCNLLKTICNVDPSDVHLRD